MLMLLVPIKIVCHFRNGIDFLLKYLFFMLLLLNDFFFRSGTVLNLYLNIYLSTKKECYWPTEQIWYILLHRLITFPRENVYPACYKQGEYTPNYTPIFEGQ